MFADFAHSGLSWTLTAAAVVVLAALLAYRAATRGRRSR